MAPYRDPIIGFYLVALGWWMVLAAAASWRGDRWAFTPRWHAWAVPAFRAFLLLSLPVEYLRQNHAFDSRLFTLGAAGTLAWLAIRSVYLWRQPAPLPPSASVVYNLFVIVNLVAFAIAMHSFICLAVMIHISIPALWLRYRWLIATWPPPDGTARLAARERRTTRDDAQGSHHEH